MGYLSHRVDPDEIKPGDHIYTWRTAFTYAHHGIYVGENKVIHFTNYQETASSVWNVSSSIQVPSSCFTSIDIGFSQPECGNNCDFDSCLCIYTCGFHQPDSGVTLSCLNCFIGTGSLYIYQYGVNKWAHISKIRGGICTIKPSSPPADVIHRAVYLLKSETGFRNYDVYKNNCEDFALYCKTGFLVYGKLATGGSGQVNSIASAPWKPVLLQMFEKVVLRTSLSPITVAATVGLYYWDRYKTDIGVRDDVVKVRVEHVESFMCARGY
ncbi:protein LEAD-SENSITIVE 1-like [Bidens hawaiensis]|uniref:protein LEAD-SENSITIVE 1-like n=1 Tax=Bidens hawaiensis TaxID=980011 RepID=UPI00404B3AE5